MTQNNISRRMPALTSFDALRFWSKVAVGAPNACWPWLAYKRNGYGCFTKQGRNYVATRVAILLSFECDPAGFHVCHECDNPQCCNPRHLFIGSGATNSLDMVAKSRGVNNAGSRHGRSKLTETDARFVRDNSHIPVVEVAAMLGVSRAIISQIRTRRVWRHIP